MNIETWPWWVQGRWAHRHDTCWAEHHNVQRWQLLRHLFDDPPMRVRPKR